MDKESELKNLEESIQETIVQQFDETCVKNKSNLGKNSAHYIFDNVAYSPEILLKDMVLRSPKLPALLKKIQDLDTEDKKKHGRLFKHFIFSDLKSNSSGAKLIGSSMIAKGYKLGYTAKLKKGVTFTKEVDDDEDDSDIDSDDERSPLNLVSLRKLKKGGAKAPKKIYEKIEFLSNDELAKNKNNNFYLLCSSSVYDQPISVSIKREILQRFNERPNNVHGENVRFIIMDSGYKEGIDLFDIKYIHIFEPTPIMANQKQIIGRGTRTCGQKGLEFHPTRGWPLNVFIYDLEIPDKLKHGLDNSRTGLELYLKSMNLDVRLFQFTHELEKISIVGSVDYELNKNIHLFSIPSEQVEEDLAEGSEFVYGGTASKRRTLRLRQDLPPLIVNSENSLVTDLLQREPKQMNFEETRQYIRDNFSQYEWNPVKMENLCVEQKGGNRLIKYTPTQDFIRHYFTPENPLKGMLLHHSVGTGKCHAKDTPILMFDGSIKMVQDVLEGDELMGDDSTPREVLSLARGQDEMYDVIPVKGDKYTVNSEHILCLKPTRIGVFPTKSGFTVKYTARYINHITGKTNSKVFETKDEAEHYLDGMHNDKKYILEIPLNEYLKLSKSSTQNIKGYRTGVSFVKQNIDFDPYIIGYWLGDGSKQDPAISTKDARVIKYLYDELPKHNSSLNYQSDNDYRISSAIPGGENKLLKCLQKNNLINNKHIPNNYKINTREIQLELLAGLIDSDGSKCNKGYDIIQKNKTLADDIVFMCRSLGFSAYLKSCEKSCMYKGEKKTGTYYRISISGDNLYEIPVKIERKKLEPRIQKKNVLVTGIEVKHVGRGDYYGFTLNGNNRYLLGDFTVTHNTCTAIACATSSFEKQGYTIIWVTRTTLKADIWKNMFDQVCNESIREEIVNNDLQIPADQKGRMKLVSKAWRIRPMSYKQFSNLIAKQNAFYNTLVKLNGQEDPLRKTLLIIDEAHKLYSGDLSTIEQPDMEKFHTALMNSYLTSGKNSVKLLLMTATPISKDPNEMIRLLNLCKKPDQQIPSTFETFSKEYLDQEGKFTEKGKDKYLDNIAGMISYLNREKDARQFSQPIIQKVAVPIIENIKMVETFDKKAVRQYLESDMIQIQNELQENLETVANEPTLTSKNFAFLKDKCNDEQEPAVKRECKKIINANIKELVSEAKDEMKRMKENVKEMRALIKERGVLNKTSISDIAKNREQMAEAYNEYKGSLYYQLKTKCAKPIKLTNKFHNEIFESDSDIVEWSRQINGYNQRIQELQTALKVDTESYKNRILRIKKLLKTNLNELERSVVKMVLRDERKTMRTLTNQKKKETRSQVDDLQKLVKKTQKFREKKYTKLRKTLKKLVIQERKDVKKMKKEEKKVQNTLMKQEGILGQVNDRIQNLVDVYSKNIDEEIEAARRLMRQKETTRKAKKETGAKSKKNKSPP
uniref:DOD-type homing endonuclease domain-containing protein n=1 Tax=viral metagenome TaxID=1070528 RepID=A0A6C0B8X4_9ZZZZ